MVRKMHWFQYVSAGVFLFFFSIMIYVTYTAFTRTSGGTHLDMVKIQKIRYDAELNRHPVSPKP